MAAYYNEFDPYAAQWLRELIKRGLIVDGEVDDRSIVEVRGHDLRGFEQCHFFAGIGGWSYALRLAGWPDDRPVWTGSCPCQPFSAAGKRQGVEDERHLWPEFHRLIRECRPAVVFGEQVASKDGLAWLDTVCADMEGEGYAIGAADLCAAGVGAPHIRQRTFFGAVRLSDADRERHAGFDALLRQNEPGRDAANLSEATGGGAASGLANSNLDGSQGRSIVALLGAGWGNERDAAGRSGGPLAFGLADADREAASRRRVQRPGQSDGEGYGAARERPAGLRADGGTGPTNGHWRNADLLFCRDGKWRPVEPGTLPLANGIPARVGRLRGYGNAIVPQVAAEFIRAIMEVVGC